jgi:hypothetical protein
MKIFNAICVATALFFACVGVLFTAALIAVSIEELGKPTKWMVAIDKGNMVQAERRWGKFYINDCEVIINVPYVAVKVGEVAPSPRKSTGKGSNDVGVVVPEVQDSVPESFRSDPDVLHPTL